jgi:hypothetical protein
MIVKIATFLPFYFSDIQWSTGEDTPGMGDEMEAAYEEFLRMQS